MPTRESIVQGAAKQGSEYALQHFRSKLEVEEKSSKTDLVTEIDKEAQHRIAAYIRDRFPNDQIVGEEGDERKTVPDTGYAWIIDPIDGTQNYIRGYQSWVTSVALVHDGEPIHSINIAPALDEQYRATTSKTTRNTEPIAVSERADPETHLVAPTLRWRATDSEEIRKLSKVIIERFGELRRIGSAQLTLSLVASGTFDVAIGLDPSPNPWDTIAGAHHVQQAGGTVTDLHNNDWHAESEGIIASNGAVHGAIVDTVSTALK